MSHYEDVKYTPQFQMFELELKRKQKSIDEFNETGKTILNNFTKYLSIHSIPVVENKFTFLKEDFFVWLSGNLLKNDVKAYLTIYHERHDILQPSEPRTRKAVLKVEFSRNGLFVETKDLISHASGEDVNLQIFRKVYEFLIDDKVELAIL